MYCRINIGEEIEPQPNFAYAQLGGWNYYVDPNSMIPFFNAKANISGYISFLG